MEAIKTASGLVVPDGSIEKLRALAQGCQNCDLFQNATQTVFGEGGGGGLLLIGEQPGDHEDLEGDPFVGPAGRVLDEALEEAGINRSRAYVTNAVKHFKWIPRGKKRIHQRPSGAEIRACRPWLEAEIEAVGPRVLVCMGAVATESVFGQSVKVMRDRGRRLESAWAPDAFVTVHPSSILRQPDKDARHEAYAGFVADLRLAGVAMEA